MNLELLKLDGVEHRDVAVAPGETYSGGWKNGKPEGEGTYFWTDSSAYNGSWHAGLKHGWGKYTWPNEARYEGEWVQGHMHGYGTFQTPDGGRYQGNWSNDQKQGIGTRIYGNGDRYEGLWRDGQADGPGRYVWKEGNEYDGEWRSGKMHGQGTLKWATGDRYDGEWKCGMEDGVGVFTWGDGSTYEGFWAAGQKDGVGVFRPAASMGELTQKPSMHTQTSQDGEESSPRVSSHDWSTDQPVASPKIIARSTPFGSPQHMNRIDHHHLGNQKVYICDYSKGELVHEEPFSVDDLSVLFGPVHQHIDRRRRLLSSVVNRRRRRDDRLGETVYKGHRSYDLMLNLQLGIRYTITQLAKLPQPAAMTDHHFGEKLWLRFPRSGSEVTPPHPSKDFKWKDYCPCAFRLLRRTFGMDSSEYLLSICGDQALRELPSPGKSGSVFYISHDDRFIIKTIRKEETQLLLSAMPKYTAHVLAYPDTLLIRFFGVHRVKPRHGAKVRFVVMNNIYRSDQEIHRKYDLKGSTHGRTAGEEKPPPGTVVPPAAVFKDLDLDFQFKLSPARYDMLMAQLKADSEFLAGMNVMDYSLLMGVHLKSMGYGSGDSAIPPPLRVQQDEQAYTLCDEDTLMKSRTQIDSTLGSENISHISSRSLNLNSKSFGYKSFLSWRNDQLQKKQQLSGKTRPLEAHSPRKTGSPRKSFISLRRSGSSGAVLSDGLLEVMKTVEQVPAPVEVPPLSLPQLNERMHAGHDTDEQEHRMSWRSDVAQVPEALPVVHAGEGCEGRLTCTAEMRRTPHQDVPRTPRQPLGHEEWQQYDESMLSRMPAGLSPTTTTQHKVGSNGHANSQPSSARHGMLTPGKGTLFSMRSTASELSRSNSAPASNIRDLIYETPMLGTQYDPSNRGHLTHRSDMAQHVLSVDNPRVIALMTRLNRKLARPVSDRLVEDLLQLARHKMLQPELSRNMSRLPTAVLAARPAMKSSDLAVGGEHSGPSFGHALPAIALPVAGDAPAEEAVLYFGIIDFLQEYNMRKMLERGVKSVVQDPKTISVTEPKVYAKRFLTFLENVFSF